MTSIGVRIVEVYVFRRARGRAQYLLLQRSEAEPLYPGIWQIVTGTIENGESALAAARREFGEETGLRMKRMWTVPSVGSFFDVSSDLVQFCPQFAVEVEHGAEPVLSAEHQSCRWVALAQARRLLTWPGQRQAAQLVHDCIAKEKRTPGLTEIHLV